MPVLDWNPSFSPIGMTIVLFTCGLICFLLYRKVRMNRTAGEAAMLLVPKLLIILLILFALLDPTLRYSSDFATPTKINILLDISSSMDLKDDGTSTRAQRAAKLIQRLEASAPSQFQFQILPFDTAIHPANYLPKPAIERGTDLASLLTTPLDQPLLADSNGEVIITDGGDETIDLPKLPSRPLAIIGVGAPSDAWCDIGVGPVTVPATVEENSQFELQAEIYARQGTLVGDGAELPHLKVTLEQLKNNAWTEVQNQVIDLSSLHAITDFHLQVSGTGTQQYRVSLPKLPGEITTANNTRNVSVQVEKRALHVLYFTQELGVDYKYLRNELATDPGVALTAMYRVLEDQSTIQGDRTGFQDLVTGFPAKSEILKRYDCVVLGSFSANQLNDAQQQTLLQFVQDGGSVIFLGGDASFGLGGYADSKLAALIPWQIRKDEPTIAQGSFPVTVAPSAGSVSFSDGWSQDLASSGGASLESLNLPGNLRPGAIALLDATMDGKTVPVVAFQHYGKGQALGIASNTLWKWATSGVVLHDFYGKFLRQTVRGLTQRQEGGALLGVHWDRDHYRPGETAQVSIRLQDSSKAGEIRLVASLQTPSSGSKPVQIDSLPCQPGFYEAKVLFQERGDYVFHLDAYRGEQVAENYVRDQKVEPLIEEGADPELKEAYLQDIAVRTKGVYCNEKDIALISAFLRQQIVPQISAYALHLVGAWYLVLILAILIVEWTLRRRINLI